MPYLGTLMSNCDMCGQDKTLVYAFIEGTQLKVCDACSKYGKVSRVQAPPKLSRKQRRTSSVPVQEKVEIVEIVTAGYSKILRRARENLRLTQKEFARRVNLKESIIHKMETGSFEPSLIIAKQLQSMLKIRLIEQVEETNSSLPNTKADDSKGFTISDFIKHR